MINQLPYKDIELLPENLFGWFCEENADLLRFLITIYPIRTVIEVGSYLGFSTCYIAKLLPPGGKLYAVDHWQGSQEHQVGGENFYIDPALLYQQFLSNVIHQRLTDIIIPVKMNSLEAASHLSHLSADLIYIDAGHEEIAVYQDLVAYYPFIKGHGILCGDDYSWRSVVIAVNRFAKERDLKLTTQGNFWFINELVQ